MNTRLAIVAATAVIAVSSAIVAPSSVSAASTSATPALPVAWRATSAATLNAPALAPIGVVTTAGNVATARGLAHGALLWKQAVPDQSGYTVSLGAPTVDNGVVDAVMGIVFGQGTADFALTNGAQTISDPGLHALLGQLVVDSVTSTRVQGGYGSGVGPWYELNLGGDTWFLEYGGSSPGLPALVERARSCPSATTCTPRIRRRGARHYRFPTRRRTSPRPLGRRRSPACRTRL